MRAPSSHGTWDWSPSTSAITRNAIAAAGLLVASAFLLVGRSRRPDGGRADQLQRDQRDERAEAGPDEGAGDHVERVVHAQVNAREGHRVVQAVREPTSAAGG